MKRSMMGILFLMMIPLCFGSGTIHKVTNHSELQKNLGLTVLIADKHRWARDQGVVVPMADVSDEYTVKFQAPFEGLLQEAFGLVLSIREDNALIVTVPVEMRSPFSGVGSLSAEFRIKKSLLSGALLTIRCGSPLLENSYAIQLADFLHETHVH